MTDYISLDKILIEDRQREDLGDIEQLKTSIQAFGILSPVLLRKEDNRLIAGGRRCESARQLGLKEVPYIYKENLTDSQLSLIELIENIHRKQLTWQEETLGVEKTFREKSREGALSGSSWTVQQTADLLGYAAKSQVSYMIRIGEYMRRDPEKKSKVWRADSFAEALRFKSEELADEAVKMLAKSSITPIPVPDNSTPELSIYDEETQDAEKNEARERYLFNPLNDPSKFDEYWEEKQREKAAQSVQTIHLSKSLFLADCLSFMSDRGESFCQHIITDIPYGIDMSMLDQQNQGIDTSTVEAEHEVEANLQLFTKFFPAAFSALADKGFLVTWCDFEHWSDMKALALSAGFLVQRWPFIWCKTSSCINQAAQYNFTKNIEVALVCRKKSALLAQPLNTSYVSSGKDELCEQIGHVFAKPFAVWRPLIESVSKPGDLVYEPFAGRGSGVISCLKLGRRVMATELQETHYSYLLENVKQHYTKALGTGVKFA